MPLGDVVLALLDDGPRHGYDLKRRHDGWFEGARPLPFAQVYATLGRLERDGLVTVAHVESGGGPDRTVYELTPTGRDRVATWIAEPIDVAPPAAEEMIRKTVAAIRTGRDPVAYVGRQREILLRRMHALTVGGPVPGDPNGHGQGHGDGAGDAVSALVREHAVAHLDADLRWLDIAAQLLADPSPSES